MVRKGRRFESDRGLVFLFGRRRSSREPGVDDVVDEAAAFEAVVPQDALAHEARRVGETLHRSVLWERAQLYAVQAELALRPADQEFDRLASDPGTARPGQHEDAQSGTPVGPGDPDEPDLPDQLAAVRWAMANQWALRSLPLSPSSANVLPNHSAFSWSGSMPSI